MQKSKPYYSSIDELPCWNFDKVIETGDFSFLCKDGEHHTDNLAGVWHDIYDEFIQAFGVSEAFKMYINKMQQFVEHLDNAINGGDRSQLTMAEVRRRQAEDYMKTQQVGEVSIYAIVSKYMGFPCRPKEVTVKEFYEYLKMAKNG